MRSCSPRVITAGCLALSAATAWAQGVDRDLTVRDLPAPGLVWFKPSQPLNRETPLVLDDDSGSVIRTQLDADGRLWWYQPQSCDGQGRTYRLREARSGEGGGGEVKIEPGKAAIFTITIDGKPFTTFNYGADLPKPFLYPVIGPTGVGVTDDSPKDHPHHRSIWAAHGDVRLGDFDKPGTDYWAQDKPGKPPTKGLQKVHSIVAVQSGPVFGLIRADLDWVAAAGKKELSETRTYTFYRTGESERIIDVRVAFKFTEGDVMFADTKEGGLAALRLAPTMTEQHGGKMTNSAGRKGMSECWGQPADWCDYVGDVAGQAVGIAVFDAKTNFRHPTRWHIRNYGLYTANPFMAGTVTGEQKKKDPGVKLLDGAQTWKKGETVEFNYRILIHKGDMKQAKIAEQYRLYAEPAKVQLK